MDSYETKILEPEQGIPLAVESLLQGELVAFPTETVYGLGAIGIFPEAVAKIFQVKGRPQDNPLILHFTSPAAMEPYIIDTSPYFEPLSRALMPGPLTLIMPATAIVPHEVTAGLKTLGVRCPVDPTAQALLRAIPNGLPLAAPSANLSGQPSPTLARDVYEDLQGKIPYILDGGASQVGLESTILDLTDPEGLRILRPGFISEELIASVLDAAGLDYHFATGSSAIDDSQAPKSPGMKYRHYAPRTKVTILEGKDMGERLQSFEEWRKTLSIGPLGIYGSSSFVESIPEQSKAEGLTVFAPAEGEDPSLAQAAALFRVFREADRLGIQELAVEAMSEGAVATAYMNRLRKASDASVRPEGSASI